MHLLGTAEWDGRPSFLPKCHGQATGMGKRFVARGYVVVDRERGIRALTGTLVEQEYSHHEARLLVPARDWK